MIKKDILTIVKGVEKDLKDLKSTQIFSGDNMRTYSGSASVALFPLFAFEFYSVKFTATTSKIEVISGFEVDYTIITQSPSMNTFESLMLQISTDKDDAKFECSWLVTCQFGTNLGQPVIPEISITGKIITRTPSTTSVDYEGVPT